MTHAAVTAKATSMHTTMANATQARFMHTRAFMHATKRAWLRTHAAGTVAPFACYTPKSF